ncbi:MAG: pyrroline-5-carboxylate reductase [Eubacteriales bacterium]
MKYKAGFIGCGNMGGALARAAARSVGGSSIAVCDHNYDKVALLCSECGTTALDFESIWSECDFVFLGMKPQKIKSSLDAHIELINKSNCVIVTMAAGTEISFYERYLGINRPIIRIMPNTPCSIGSGMIQYACSEDVSEDNEKCFCEIMTCAGVLDKISEGLIDAASAVSGCGPAFAFIFAEALADAGVECGLPREKALLYAAQMLKGSAELILANGNPGKLKDSVCSPGGTTIAGVHALEESAFRAAAMNAVTAAYRRTLELKK